MNQLEEITKQLQPQLTELPNEVVDLLQLCERQQEAITYLCNVHAASYECVPGYTSKTARRRGISILETCKEILQGNLSGVYMFEARDPCDVLDRCTRNQQALKDSL